MNESQNTLQRIGGYLVLLVVALMLLLAWRTSLAGGAGSPLTAAVTANATVISAEVTPVFLETEEEPLANVETAAGAVPVLSDNSLAPALDPHTYEGKKPQHEFETYVVERGDTPAGIAEKFGIEPETLLGGNPQLSEESSLLQTGVELIILPVDGVLHDVQPGETLESISNLYGIPVEEIVAYEPNNLDFTRRVYPDTQILVPGAVRELFVWTPPDLSSVRSSYEGRGVAPVIVGTGTFIYPVNSRNFTQYYWYGHRAIDIGLSEGSAVYASDTGTVTFAGWNIYGYGNLIVVNHGNGFETFYAHLNAINVVPGQIVYQGNVIGASGNSGNSSGPHLHFEIRLNGNQDDPCWYVGGC